MLMRLQQQVAAAWVAVTARSGDWMRMAHKESGADGDWGILRSRAASSGYAREPLEPLDELPQKPTGAGSKFSPIIGWPTLYLISN